MRIFYENHIDAALASLVASSEVAAYPVGNLAHHFRTKPWRSGVTLVAEEIEIDLGSALDCGALILLDHNLEAGQEVTLELATLADFSDAMELAAEVVPGSALVLLFPEVEVRYARVTITKLDAADTVEVGRLFLGPVVILEEPDDSGLAIDTTDLSKNSRSLGGQVYSEERGDYRSLKIPLSSLDTDQVAEVLAMASYCKIVRPFFIEVQNQLEAPNTDAISEVFYVRLKDRPKYTNEAVNGRRLSWKMSLDLEEES